MTWGKMSAAPKKIGLVTKNRIVLGLDFDNTIISYDDLIHDLAVERGFIPQTFPRQKRIISKRIREAYGEKEWQKLQAVIYGARMREAKLSEGVGKFLEQCRKSTIPMYIISHKTQYSNLFQGGVNFHTAARAWMEQQQLFTRFRIQANQVYFAATREEKVRLIHEYGCTHFIDDLEEVFQEKNFPTGVIKILYAPGENALGEKKRAGKKRETATTASTIIHLKHWREIYDYFFQ